MRRQNIMKKNEIELLLNVLLILAIFFAVAGFMQDIANTAQYGGIDLRNRVVGARLAKNDFDPYFYKWNEGDPNFFLDPRDHPNLPVNRVTVTPTVLQLHSIFCDLPYLFQRYFWTFIQWGLLIAIILLFTNGCLDKFKLKLIWLTCLFFVADSYIFRLHVERGQIYILYTFLFALSYYFYHQKHKFSEIISGVIAGYAASLRFPMIILGLPFLVAKRWKFIAGKFFGFVLGIGSSLLFVNFEVWKSYFKAMNIHGLVHEGIIKITMERYPHLNIEDVKDLYIWARLPISDSSLQGMLKNVGIQLSANILLIVFLVLALMIMIVFSKINSENKTPDFIFLFGIFIVLLNEFFLPASRYNYNDVILLIPISLIIIDSNNIFKMIKSIKAEIFHRSTRYLFF